MLSNTLIVALKGLSIKYLYILDPKLNGLQIVYFFSIISTLLSVLVVNKGLVDALRVEKGQRVTLILRCLQEVISPTLAFSIYKYFKLSTISIIQSLAPILTLIMAACLLSEKISVSDTI